MMMFDSFRMEARWGARVETPAALARSFLAMMDDVDPLHPCFHSWGWADQQELWESECEAGIYPFAEVRKNLIPAIERNAGTAGENIPDPFYGYLMTVAKNATSSDSITLSVSAGQGVNGGSTFRPFMNNASFSLGLEPEPSLVSYDLLKAIFLILSEKWEATWAEASPGSMPANGKGLPVNPAWMSYVSPRFAALMTPPPSAIVERRPNGGLFLAATRDVFEMANPAHMTVARDIEAALQPLNRIPNPNDAPYR